MTGRCVGLSGGHPPLTGQPSVSHNSPSRAPAGYIVRAQPEIQAGVDSSPFFGHQRIGAIAIAMTSPNQGVPRPQPGHTPHNPASGGYSPGGKREGGESPVTGVIAGNHRQIVSPVTGVIAGRLTENCITGKTPLSRHGPTGDCPGCGGSASRRGL
jgi:hypothetical protein